MGIVCCVKGCKRQSFADCGISFHRLPTDEIQRKQWIEVIPGRLSNSSMICRLHFKPEDYRCTESMNKLKPGAIPSIFPKEHFKSNTTNKTQFTPASDMILCPACDAPFASKVGLRHHIMAMHVKKDEDQRQKMREMVDTAVLNAQVAKRIVQRQNNRISRSKKNEVQEDESAKNEDYSAFECMICNKQFTTLEEAEKNLWQVHSGTLKGKTYARRNYIRYRCTLCNMAVPLDTPGHGCEDAPVRPKIFNEPPQPRPTLKITCMGCGSAFPSQWNFLLHVREHHMEDQEVFYFPTNADFISWKLDMQLSTKCCYRGSERHGVHSYSCCSCTDGGTPPASCPSMFVEEKLPKGLQVHYYKRHYGHDSTTYVLNKQHRKFLITEFLQTPNGIDPDLYIQFKTIMENMVLETAKLDRQGLTIMFSKALEMAMFVTKVVDSEDLEEEVLKPAEEVKRSIETVVGKKVVKQDEEIGTRSSARLKKMATPELQSDEVELELLVEAGSVDTNKRSEATKRLVEVDEVEVPTEKSLEPVLKSNVRIKSPEKIEAKDKMLTKVLEAPVVAKGKVQELKMPARKFKESVSEEKEKAKEPVVPAKRLRRSVTFANHDEAKEIEKSTCFVSPKTVASQSPSFNDTYKDFVANNLSKDMTRDRKSLPDMAIASEVNKTDVLNKSIPCMKVKQKSPPKNKLRTKLGQFTPNLKKSRSNSLDSPIEKIDLSKVKIAGYEVKERENDCNILVLKF